MATITDSKRLEVDGHDVELRFFVFDTSEAIWTKEQRDEAEAGIDRLEGLARRSADQERQLVKLRQQRSWMTGKPYRREHSEFHDYGWMVTIDGQQRMGVFPRLDDAVEQARSLVNGAV